METPRPRSSIARVAAFLASVGENNTFTKMQLLEAVPDTLQAERRMRDLRGMGWIIENYKTNHRLRPEHYLVRRIGIRIDLGERRPLTSKESITGLSRRDILRRDGHTCQICGITSGIEYDDEPGKKAVLTIGYVVPIESGGTHRENNLHTVCTRCAGHSTTVANSTYDADAVYQLTQVVDGLDAKERLLGWMTLGRRTLDASERAFSEWASLPAVQRLEVITRLAQDIAHEKQ